MKNKKLFILFIILISLLTFCFVHKTFENDTFFTIATGNYIMEHGIDKVEPFTIHDGLEFTKVRYGFDLLIAFIYNLSGFTGLYIFTLLTSIAITVTLFVILNKVNKSMIISFFVTLLAIVTCSKYLVCRAQIVSYLIFILEVYFLYQLSTTGKRKYIISLIILSVILLAFHSSVWILYLIFFLPFIAEFICYYINKKVKFLSKLFIIDKIYIKELLITLLIVIITGFCTPLGLSPFTYSFMNMSTIGKDFIIELQSLSLIKTPSLMIVIVITTIELLFTKTKIKVSDLCFIIGGTILSVFAERNLYISILVMSIPFVRIVYGFFEAYKIEDFWDKIETFVNRNYVVQFPIVLFIGLFVYIKSIAIFSEEYLDKSLFPVDTVDYIYNYLDPKSMKLFTDFNDGSYVEFRGIKTFIDSRSEIYCKEFNNVTILQDWYNIEFGNYDNVETNVNNIIDNYPLTHMLCYNSAYYLSYLQSNSRFKQIYSDDYFTLFQIN